MVQFILDLVQCFGIFALAMAIATHRSEEHKDGK
jgi:hypothetical protein